MCQTHSFLSKIHKDSLLLTMIMLKEVSIKLEAISWFLVLAFLSFQLPYASFQRPLIFSQRFADEDVEFNNRVFVIEVAGSLLIHYCNGRWYLVSMYFLSLMWDLELAWENQRLSVLLDWVIYGLLWMNWLIFQDEMSFFWLEWERDWYPFFFFLWFT